MEKEDELKHILTEADRDFDRRAPGLIRTVSQCLLDDVLLEKEHVDNASRLARWKSAKAGHLAVA